LATTTLNAQSYSDTGLSPSTAYAYNVAAYDAAGNISAQSNQASATTQAVASPPPSSVTTIFQSDSTKGFNDVELSGSDFIVTESNTSNTNNRLLRISPSGTLSVIATYPGQLRGITLSGSDFIVTGYNSSQGNVLLKITSDGATSTIASNISSGGALTDVAILGSDYIVVDTASNRLLRVTSSGSISTFATSLYGAKGIKVLNSDIIVSGTDGGGQCLGTLYKVSSSGTVSVIAAETKLYICSRYLSVALDGSNFVVDSDTGYKSITSAGVISLIANPSLDGQRIGALKIGSDIVAALSFPARLLRITPSTSSLDPRAKNIAAISLMINSLNEILKELSKLLK